MTRSKLAKVYMSLQFAADLVASMFDDEGNELPFDKAKVERLKVLTREAACAANALTGTHDGKKT